MQKFQPKCEIAQRLNCEVNERDIVIVEDIVDTGLSLKYIRRTFTEKSLKVWRLFSLLVSRKP